jgi:peptidyl-Asp metalloendopeptidase
MRIYLAGIILIGTLSAGCSSDWDPSRDARAKASAEQQATPLPTATLASREGTTSFASLPDRGELLSYAKDREVRRSGAYTSYPVEISEAHALNAIAAGGLRLVTPDGKPVNIAFDRIEEHPDGNWTWVGQSGSGDHAVLTFGESAVFGEFSSGGKSYRVTTRRGAAFVVETDPRLLAGHPGHHGDGPEFLIPPSMTDSAGVAGSKAMAAAVASEEPKAAAGVIDLALGYTQGMVATYGNQATAITRLTNLVALGNAAYDRSGIGMRLRLVHTLQVNFPDNTDNSDALQKLTGYNSATSQSVTPDPAFSALRSARDQYGADLVALVRPHRSPEQKGCGIAWLIGANQRPITAADAPFGYSVVSDGSDLDEGDSNTYFCSDYSLVHELGHSMGQAHNQQDSQFVGAHAYSYGFRETASNGFHTIMAYPLPNSSQTEVGYFATPLINFASGRPLGVANASDNVRSMNQTMPIVATFRQTVVPVETGWGIVGAGDLNQDGRADIFWLNSGLQSFEFWRMNGAAYAHGPASFIQDRYVVAGVGDFNGDGRSDILWRDNARTEVWIWEATASGQFIARFVRSYPSGWEIAGVGDSNRDGRSDIIWHNPDLGLVQLWRMNGAAFTYSPQFSIGAYTIQGVGDFNGDGIADIVWVDTARTQVWLWVGAQNGTYTSQYVRSYPAGWQIVGVEDVNADGRDDIFWHSRTSQSLEYWAMNGASFSYGGGNFVEGKYVVSAVADFNGDGRADVLWRDEAGTELWIWQANTSGRFATIWLRSYPR